MFQRAKSFIIRRKKSSEDDLELPDSSHLVRRPVTASMQDRINVRAIQKNANIKPNMDFDTLREKSTSLEHVRGGEMHKTNLQKTPLVLSSDGIDTIRRKKELQKRNEHVDRQLRQATASKIPVPLKSNLNKEESKVKITKSNSQRNKLFRVNNRRKKNAEQHSEDQRNSFIFVKMEK